MDVTGKSLKRILLSLAVFCILITGPGIACAEEATTPRQIQR